MINGVLLRLNLDSISVIYKTIILTLVLLDLRKHKHIYIPFIILLMYFIIHFIIVKEVQEVISGLNWLFKFYFIYWLYLFFKKQIKNGYFNRIVNFIKFCILFLLINAGIGVLGFGYAQYSGDVGVQGLIFAGNELAVTLVCTFGFILMFSLVHNQYRNYLIFAFVFLILSLVTALKAAMFSTFLILLFFPVLKSFDKMREFKIHWKNALLSFSTLVILPIIVFAGAYYVLFHLGLWNRISFFLYHRDFDVISVLFSSRNLWAIEAFNGMKENYKLIEVVFGTSNQWLTLLSTPGKGSVEIDIIDFFMMYGVVGVLLTYGFFVKKLYQNFKNRSINPYSKYLNFLILLILFISVTAGHVLYSGVGGPVISATLAVTSFSNKQISSS